MDRIKKTLQIKDVVLDNNIVLAPLAGYTDIGMRSLCYSYGASLCYSEMVSAKGLHYNQEKTKVLLKTSDIEKPIAVQLFGSESEYFVEAISNPLLEKFDIIDINMGCPVKKIFNNGDGSALLKKPSLAYDIVKSCKKHTTKPITIKMRIGISDDSLAVDFAKAVEEAGVDAITVHGRTREQFYSGKVNLDAIAKVKSAVLVPVIGNGDVRDRDSYEAMLSTGVDGVMIGRGAVGRPYIFSELLGYEYEFSAKHSALKHIEYLQTIYDNKIVCELMKKHLCSYVYGMKGSKEVKIAVNSSTNLEMLLQVINNFFN